MNHYKFIWKGRDPQGNVRSEEVMAENAQAAREELTRRDWTELELVFDEIASASGEGVDVPAVFGVLAADGGVAGDEPLEPLADPVGS